jgi:hypothetical protein
MDGCVGAVFGEGGLEDEEALVVGEVGDSGWMLMRKVVS